MQQKCNKDGLFQCSDKKIINESAETYCFPIFSKTIYNFLYMGHRNKRANYLSPLKVIKDNQLSKKDVLAIKDNISLNMTIIRIIIAIIMSIFSFGIIIFMGVESNWKQIEAYGLSSLIAQIILIATSLQAAILIIVSYTSKNKKKVIILNRVACILLFLGITTQMLMGIYADAEMGFTNRPETLSASIIFIAVLLLIQPSYWIDAFVLNISTSISLIVLTIVLNITFQMEGLLYYIIIAVVFPVFVYFVITLLFYAECKNYQENIENERLTNKAYYDDLTQCKNRHALKLFLDENVSNWEKKENLNLLIVMFDIDNFKEYNDQFSHLGGDYCLKAICDGVRKTFPSPSLDFFRYGGEEFVLFLELSGDEDPRYVIEKIRKTTENLKIESAKGSPKEYVTISVGGTFIKNTDHFVFDEQISNIDKYLYQAKNSGKDVSCLDGIIIR